VNLQRWFLLVGFLFIILFLVSAFFMMKEPKYSREGLYPPVEQATQQLIQQMKARGILIKITEDFRSFAKQDQLYAQGRSLPGPIVTYARGGESFHNYGLAIDFALVDPQTKKLSWDLRRDRNKNGQADWQEVVQVAKQLGFAWGGDWTGFKDRPHLEMTFGQSIYELKYKLKLNNWFRSIVR
jgi:peptidoglycan L-alanyl-D-glutamate endopeptidase CwlK